MTATMPRSAPQHGGVPDAASRVLVPLDASALSTKAAAPAALLADRFGAELRYLMVVGHEFELNEGRRLLRSHLAAGLPHGLPEVRVASDPALAIVAAAREAETLICMASHGRRRVSEVLLGSVAEAVLHHNHAPTLLVGPHLDADLLTGPRRIVACIDGTPLSETVLPVAASWALELGLDIDLVRIVESADRGDESGLRALAERVAGETGVVPACHQLTAPRPPAAITAFAAEPGTIVALATHGRTGLARLALGSVAVNVLHASPVPVLAVMAHGRPAVDAA